MNGYVAVQQHEAAEIVETLIDKKSWHVGSAVLFSGQDEKGLHNLIIFHSSDEAIVITSSSSCVPFAES
jgi:hypothetical protein